MGLANRVTDFSFSYGFLRVLKGTLVPLAARVPFVFFVFFVMRFKR
jgi:hypothetical protein